MWIPNDQGLLQVTQMIREATTGTSNERHRQIAEEINRLSETSEFLLYLSAIISDHRFEQLVRLAAGHYMKSVIERIPKPAEINEFILESVLIAMKDPAIGPAISSVAAVLFIAVDGWVKLLEFIDSNFYTEVSILTLIKLLEEIKVFPALKFEMDTEIYTSILERIVTKIIPAVESEHLLSLRALNRLIDLQLRVLVEIMPRIVDLIIRMLENNTEGDLAAELTESLVSLSENRRDILSKKFQNIAEFMLSRVESLDNSACEFFSIWLKNKSLIIPYLARLLQILFANLKMGELDLMDQIEDNEEARFDDSEIINNWSPRKESSILLNELSINFGSQCFIISQKTIEDLLTSPEWLEAESGLLGLGSIAIGCMDTLRPSLPSLAQFLLDYAKSPHPMVESMALWCASRFTSYLVSSQYFENYLLTVLDSILSQNSKVQISSCTALCILITSHPECVFEYIQDIVSIVFQAFSLYKGRPILSILDVVASMAEELKEQLNIPSFINEIVPAMTKLWNETPNESKLIWTILETWTALYLAIGPCLSELSSGLFIRTLTIIELGLPQNGKESEFALNGLELAGTILETDHSVPGKSRLMELCILGLQSGDISLKQYSASTAGDLIVASSEEIRNYIQILLPELVNCLDFLPGESEMALIWGMTCNNASLALGEIAVYLPNEIFMFVPTIIQLFIGLLKKPLRPEGVKNNILICSGKLALVHTEAYLEYVEYFFKEWCLALKGMEASVDKEASVRGVLEALSINPGVLDFNFNYFAESMLGYVEMSPDLRVEVSLVMESAKSIAGNGWEAYLQQLPFGNELQAYFNF